MSLIYITGVSGTGKSTILKELQARGYKAYGVDENGYADWVNHETGNVDIFPHNDPDLVDMHQWFHHHAWVINAKKIAELKRRVDSSHTTIFLCGAGIGEEAAWQYFDCVIALLIDPDTLKLRIAARTDNQYGKTSEELTRALAWQAKHNATYYAQRGAILVDATQPVEVVVGSVVECLAAYL